MTRTRLLRSSNRRSLFAATFLVVVAPAATLAAQDVAQQGSAKEILAKESYVRPPASIERILTAPSYQNVTLANQSPDRKHFLKLQSEGMPTVQSFGKPHYYLAGLPVDYKANR
jgi:hypothetical protein